MSRSCHSATSSSPTTEAARTTRARPQSRSATTGLRLCGIAELPFWPRPKGSWTSPTSERERRQELCVAVARDHLGDDWLGHEAEASAGDALHLWIAAAVHADRACD